MADGVSPRVQGPVVGAAAAAGVLVAVGIGRDGPLALFALGLAFGIVLYQAAFGFTSAFRVFLANGQGSGVRAILLMLGVACVLFYPTLGMGRGHGFVVRLDTALVAGALLFGIGMQLGGGCGSGTLFAVGGGSVRMLLTLVCFVLGSVAGVAQAPDWAALPGRPAVSLIAELGWGPALAATLAGLAVLWRLTAWVELRRVGSVRPLSVRDAGWRGPWPLAMGAVALAVLNYATLLLAGQPWGITSAFGLWGARALTAASVPLSGWGGWAEPGQQAALDRPLLGDVVTVMDIGIVLGALAASGLAGRFAVRAAITPRSALAAVLGGVLMGYGARLASGCNIGAFFSGVASGSVHGWVWLVCALAGNALGLRLRPWFGLAVERRAAAC